MRPILTAVIFTILLLTNSCKADTFEMYKDSVHEMIQDPKTRKFKESYGDADDLRGCQYLIELGQWQKNNNKRWGLSLHRQNVWKDGRIEDHRIFGLDTKNKLSTQILPDKNFYPIYIAPWHYSPTIGKNIRFFAYYPKEGGNISHQYESQTEENKFIPEKPFSLSPTAKIAPDRFGLCVVKWTAKYGYNAIAETEKKFRPGFFAWLFRDYELVPTGKIIEVKE